MQHSAVGVAPFWPLRPVLMPLTAFDVDLKASWHNPHWNSTPLPSSCPSQTYNPWQSAKAPNLGDLPEGVFYALAKNPMRALSEIRLQIFEH